MCSWTLKRHGAKLVNTEKRAYTETETSTYIGMSRSFYAKREWKEIEKNAPPPLNLSKLVELLDI